MNTGNKIFLLRTKAGCSREELAEVLNVSAELVDAWENEKSVPVSDSIINLSNAFGISTDVLLKDDVPVPDSVEFNNASVSNSTKSDYSFKTESETADTGEFVLPPDFIASAKKEEKAPQTASAYALNQSGKKKKSGLARKIIALVGVLGILVSIIGILATGGIDKAVDYLTEDYIKYPYILVHGLGGWGSASKMSSVAEYWGATTGSLASYLESEGYEVYEPTVGPFSSAWDRTCELYAQLTGTKVDYGEAHSKEHGHERYGKEYKRPMFAEWGTETPGGQLYKINLVGHSFGGVTVRLLTHLLEYGAPEEVELSGKDNVSELFTGGKGNWINSVTALCAPHNGSTLYYVLDTFDLPSLLLKIFSAFAGSAGGDISMLDFQLEHFGIGGNSDDAQTVIKEMFSSGNDNAAYDLSPEGAQKLNERIELVPNVYYFSYAYSTTHEGKILGNHVPDSDTLIVLRISSILMGAYKENKTSDYVIDESWLENDGLVNVVSARYPFDEEWQNLDENNIVKGVWNVAPTGKGDHGKIVGLGADKDETHKFYDNLFKMIDTRPRDKERYYALPGKE